MNFEQWWNEEGDLLPQNNYELASTAWQAAIESIKDIKVAVCSCGNYDINHESVAWCRKCDKQFYVMPWKGALNYLHQITVEQRDEILAYRKQVDELKDKLEKTKSTWTTESPKVDGWYWVNDGEVLWVSRIINRHGGVKYGDYVKPSVYRDLKHGMKFCGPIERPSDE